MIPTAGRPEGLLGFRDWVSGDLAEEECIEKESLFPLHQTQRIAKPIVRQSKRKETTLGGHAVFISTHRRGR
jgi:hypothetical protein